MSIEDVHEAFRKAHWDTKSYTKWILEVDHIPAEKWEVTFITALMVLGEPPHPTMVINPYTVPPELMNDKSIDRNSSEWEDKITMMQWEQLNWNKKCNRFAVRHQLYGTHKGWGPAQFRRVFAEWLELHACKTGANHEQISERR